MCHFKITRNLTKNINSISTLNLGDLTLSVLFATKFSMKNTHWLGCLGVLFKVVSTMLFLILFVSYSYCGVCYRPIELSICDVIVVQKKFRWRKKVHILWVGLLLSSHSFTQFTVNEMKKRPLGNCIMC